MTSDLNHSVSTSVEAPVSSKQVWGFFVAEPDGRIVEANAVMMERLGMAQEAVGPESLLHCQSILSSESWTLWEQQWPCLEQQRFIGPLALVFQSLDGQSQGTGRLLSAQVSITALRDGSGSGGCIVQFEDTEQLIDATKLTSPGRPTGASTSESIVAQDREPLSADGREYFRMLADASPAQIYDMAPDGTLRFLNQTALDFFSPERLEEIVQGRWEQEVHPDDLERLNQAVQNGLKTRTPYRVEARAKGREGVYRWFLITVTPSFYSNGEFYGLIVYSIDITALKEAELELKTSEERFRIISNATPAHIFDLAPDGTFRFQNQAILDFLSVERLSEIKKGNWASEVHPDDRENFTRLVQNALTGKRESYRVEIRFKGWDGVYRWFLSSGVPTYYPNGDFYGLIGFSIDITALKEYELELKTSEERFRIIANASPAHIFDMAPDGTFRFLNQAALDFLSPERMPELLKGYWAPAIHPDDLENATRLVQQALAGKRESYRTEMRFKRRDGVYRWFLHSGMPTYYPNGDFYGLVGYSIDITALKETELELKTSEERFRIIANASPAHIFDMAPDGTFRFLNQAVMDFIPAERQSDILTGRWSAEVHPDDLENFTQLVQQALTGKRQPYQIEFRSKRRDGVYRWFFHSGVPTYYPNGDFYGLVGYTMDITALKEAEFALRESETRWRDMANVVPIMLWVSDTQGEAIFINDWWYQYTGLSPGESLGMQWMATVHPEDIASVLVHNGKYLLDEPFELECRYRRADGAYRWHFSRVVPNKDANGKLLNWYGTSIDIHDRRIVEQELSKAKDIAEEASKKKSQFLANMSHELRTPLNAVIGFSDMMKKGMAGPLTDRQDDYIGHISTSGRHLLTLVNDILDISKAEAGKIELTLQYVELEPFIQQLLELVSYSMENSGVTVTFELQPGLTGLMADSDRLKQIFMNLLSNAVKFNHRGGQVKVSLARSEDNQWVICAIRDTGIGIPADKIDNLFSEFYQVDSSIARRYEGTGLGLALTKRLVELHHGTITVESQVDVGSTFTFKLPLNP